MYAIRSYYATDSIPPAGSMDGVDLVTEGVLTIKALIELVKKCKNNMYEVDLRGKLNSAEKLFKLIRECDDIDILVGRKVNTFYHNVYSSDHHGIYDLYSIV